MKSVVPTYESVGSATCDYCGLPLSGAALTTREKGKLTSAGYRSDHDLAKQSEGEVPLEQGPTDDEPSYCCFGCRFASGISTTSKSSENALGPASALGFSIFFTMNVVMLTMALWSYAAQSQSPFEVALGNFLRYGAMVFSLPVLLLLGRPLISHAWIGVRRGLFTTDLLLATGVLAAFAVSILNTWRGQGHVYFEVGCVILVLVTMGRWLEAAGRFQASSALDQLEQLVPDTVRCRVADCDINVPRTQIVIGDRVHVLAGERIPVDGCVLQGRGVVDEQFFTGESAPVEKQRDDQVLGGSLNLDGDLILEVTAAANAGALGRLVDAVRAARLSKGRYQLLSDAWSQRVFPIISVVAVVAFLVHGLRVNWDYGLLTALSVVLIACPCALALATPLAVWAALGTAAKRGVLFRSGAALETLATIRAIRWDKTGTLTTGSPRVLRLYCENVAERTQLERVALSITEASDHVYSQAIHEFLTSVEPITTLTDIQTVAGRGLRATSETGQTIVLGSMSWMEASGLAWGPNLSAVLVDPVTVVSPLTVIGYDGQVRGLFLLEETIRPEAATALQACQNLGLNQAVLTGDRKARAAGLAASLAPPTSNPSFPWLAVEAELLPQDKLASIKKAHAQFGSVAMVGDGLNDAPALAGADVGIALGCGADVSRDSADVCLLSTDLRLIPWSYEFSRQTVRTIRTNLAWSFGYNSLGVVVAACGQLHPAVAAGLMVGSSLMVLGNSLRLSTEGPFGLRRVDADPNILSDQTSTIASTTSTESVP